MKKIFLLATAFALTLGVMGQSKADSMISVNQQTHDFGKVKQGVPVNYAFQITNNTKEPIVVENTWASCGCTTPDKIVEPIQPGKTVDLKVQYNAAAAGPINKDVFIKLAGADQPKTVHITGEVVPADAYDAMMKEKEAADAQSKTKTKTKN
jgi:hypothetical protein